MANILVNPSVRTGETSYPAHIDSKAPLPLKDLAIEGDYTEFRHLVWRSLLTYPEISYDYMDAYRLVEIQFERDAQYQTVRDLVGLDLLILTLGVMDLPNRYIAPLVCQILIQRLHAGLPTWVYTSTPFAKLGDVYTPELSTLLKPRQYVEPDRRVKVNPSAI